MGTTNRKESEHSRNEAAGDQPANERDTNSTETLSKDVIFELLHVSRRRSALRWLAEWDGQATTGQLAEHIAAEETGLTVRELNSKQRKRVYIPMYQSHLPKLADHGVITFDEARGTVELTERADDLFPYLDIDREGSSESPAVGCRCLCSIIPNRLLSSD